MKKSRFFLVVFFLFAFQPVVRAQSPVVDSLAHILKTTQQDTTRAAIYLALSEVLAESNFDTVIPLCTKACNIIKQLPNALSSLKNVQRIKAAALNNIGYAYSELGGFKQALENLRQSLKIQEATGNKSGAANALLNIGYVYSKQGDVPKTLEYFGKALRKFEEIKDAFGTASALNNIGFVYHNLGDSASALKHYKQSLHIHRQAANKNGIAESLNNIGGLYSDQMHTAKALQYFNQSLTIRQDIGDLQGAAYSLISIGRVYQDMHQMDSTLVYYNKSLRMVKTTGDQQGLAYALEHLGGAYYEQQNYSEAKKYALQSMKLGRDLGYLQNIEMSAALLSKIYKATGDYKSAMENYELYVRMRDSTSNLENQKAAAKQQIRYEYDKKAAADSVASVKQKEIHRAEIRAKKNQQYALFGGLALVLLFAVFMYNRFRVTQKQKRIIEQKEQETQKQNLVIAEQKHLVEEKHKEITDSINYAERIQRSFLATQHLLDTNLPGYFVLFQPKDVVSGDFYWACTLANGHFCIAAADSTGHGVPGAIMSILNITCLENAVKEGNVRPAEILNHTRLGIIDRLKKDGSAEGGKDGMDCSLLSFDFQNNAVDLALANNPLWLIRNGNCIEYRADKMPVGKHDKQDTSFTNQTIALQKGDTLYVFTDGYPDQFGGEKGKKFKYANLQKLLTEQDGETLQTIHGKLRETFARWKGDLEQVDDVCIIGIRI